MAKAHGPSVKDDRLYRTKEELEDRAREIGIEGHSEMTKDELIDALRNH
jgi:hypothetical protein